MAGMKILSAILIMVPATVLLTAEVSFGEPAAEPCKASPGDAAPRGMHWYYRINRATNKHCWYLGPVGHLKSHTQAAAASDSPPARKVNPTDADTAASAEAMTADKPEAATPLPDGAGAQPSPTQTARAQGLPAQGLPAQAVPAQALPPQALPPQALPAQGLPAAQAATADAAAGDPHFGARWPDNLPNAEELEQSEAVPAANSTAERRDADASAPLPSGRAGTKAARAAPASSGETALSYFSIAGIFLIPLLLAAGWMAKFARESDGSIIPDRLRAMAEGLRRRRRREAFSEEELDEASFNETEFDEAAFDEAIYEEDEAREPAPPISPALAGRRAGADWRARTPTDPAQDLKRSLTELMHDLRRAAGPDDTARHAQRSDYRGDERVLSPSLQPAE
jgi:hypothetical protein